MHIELLRSTKNAHTNLTSARHVLVLGLYNGLYGTEIYLQIHDDVLLDYF